MERPDAAWSNGTLMARTVSRSNGCPAAWSQRRIELNRACGLHDANQLLVSRRSCDDNGFSIVLEDQPYSLACPLDLGQFGPLGGQREREELAKDRQTYCGSHRDPVDRQRGLEEGP